MIRVTDGRLFVMTKFLLLGTCAMAVTYTLHAQDIPRPSVPDQIKAPANEEVVLVAHATGSQIYTCEHSNAAFM
jgi:hypothetical protein